jgi:hypothetical protein
MHKANAATADKAAKLVREREGLTFAARCLLFLDFDDVAAACEPWMERRITWHAWQLVLRGKVQIHPALRKRVETRAQTLREIRNTIAPELWKRAVRNLERTPLWA